MNETGTKVEVVTRVEKYGRQEFIITSIYEPDMERMKAAVKVLLNCKVTEEEPKK